MSEFDKNENVFNTTAENQTDGANITEEAADVNANQPQFADESGTESQNMQESAQNSGYFDYTGTQRQSDNFQSAQNTNYTENVYNAQTENNAQTAGSEPNSQSSFGNAANQQASDSADNNSGYFDYTSQYAQNVTNNGGAQDFSGNQQSMNSQNANAQYGAYSSNPQNGQFNSSAQNMNSQNTQQYIPYQQNYGYGTNNYPPVPNRPVKNGRTGIKVFCVLLAVAIIVAGVAGISYVAGKAERSYIDDEDGIDTSTGNTVTIQQGTVPEKDGVEPDEEGKYTADGVAQIVSDSVVNIMVYNDSVNSNSSAAGGSASGNSGGAIASGIIISKDGYVLSNDHIYADIPSAKFAVTLNNGKSYSASYVAGDSRSDLCVLKIKDAPSLTPAVFADSSKLAAGEDVIAIGSPYNLSGTVTKGIISAPSRRISFQSKSGDDGAKSVYSMRVIQTDTAINSGNSGGALVNMYGQVVGVCSSKIVLSGYEGLCFAIPSNDAIKYSKSLIANKKVKGRAKLGISYKEINSAAALINDCPAGIMIQSIDVDSELYSSGVKQGDIVTEINGTEITSSDKALDIIDDSKAGDEVTLKVYISSSKSYKTVKTKMLEDASVSSYSAKSEQQTSAPFTFKFQNEQ